MFNQFELQLLYRCQLIAEQSLRYERKLVMEEEYAVVFW